MGSTHVRDGSFEFCKMLSYDLHIPVVLGGINHLNVTTNISLQPARVTSSCDTCFKNGIASELKACSTLPLTWSVTCGLVFATQTGGPLDPASLTRRFRSFLERAGLRRIRFHDLRHSTATLLLEQDIDLVVIKELLGHAHIGVTAGVYAHVRLRLQRQAIDALGDARGPTADEPEDPPAAAVVR
ncbi:MULTISPECIES: tyrosine-type recombinase/integrase [unclassified Streptomyces]|uniref:tyrosine-type recombinase/integrase n=1 Tax=unclassified Streptomyces TaxID=2593676 RepID=UPI003870BE65